MESATRILCAVTAIRKRISGRRQLWVVGVTAVFGAIGLFGILMQDDDGAWKRIGPVIDGVSVASVDGVALFVVRADDRVQAFVARQPGPSSGEPGGPLWWCPDEAVFFAPGGPAAYDRTGASVKGPTSPPLDSVPSRIVDGAVLVQTSRPHPVGSGDFALVQGPSPDQEVLKVLHALMDRSSLHAEQERGFCTVPLRARQPKADPLALGAYPGRPWTGPGGEAVVPSIVSANDGSSHCGLDLATFLRVGWPLGTVARSAGDTRTYVRDPEGVVKFRPEIASGFRADVRLPSDAVATGYRSDTLELWLSPAESDRWMYVKSPTSTERWPRVEGVICA